jgi:hypothetical protein
LVPAIPCRCEALVEPTATVVLPGRRPALCAASMVGDPQRRDGESARRPTRSGGVQSAQGHTSHAGLHRRDVATAFWTPLAFCRAGDASCEEARSSGQSACGENDPPSTASSPTASQGPAEPTRPTTGSYYASAFALTRRPGFADACQISARAERQHVLLAIRVDGEPPILCEESRNCLVGPILFLR